MRSQASSALRTLALLAVVSLSMASEAYLRATSLPEASSANTTSATPSASYTPNQSDRAAATAVGVTFVGLYVCCLVLAIKGGQRFNAHQERLERARYEQMMRAEAEEPAQVLPEEEQRLVP